MNTYLVLFSLILLMIGGLVGCESIREVVAPEQADTVKIGFIFAGDRAPYLDAAQLAVDEVNTTGGLFGTPVELVSLPNVEASLPLSVQAAEDMILKDGVIALIGPNRSSHAAEVAPIAQRYGIPMITTTATNPNVTNAGDFVFMASFTDSFQGRVMAQFAKEDLGINTAAVITRRGDLYTEGISEFFVRNFSELGGEVVASEFYEGEPLDFTTQLTNIAAAQPDVLFTAGFGADIVLITQQARAIPLQNAAGEPTIFLGADSWDSDIVLGNADAEVEGSFFTTHFSPDTDEPTAQAFVNAYQSVYGTVPTGGMAVNYDAVKLLFEAIQRAGSLEPEAIRDQLRATENYVGATRIGSYDENRHPTKSVVIFTVKDGDQQFYKQIDP